MILYLIPPPPVKRRIRKAPSPFQAKEHQSRAHRPGRQISVGTARSVILVGRPPRVFETAKNLEALIYGRQIRVAPAEASACRLSLPAAGGTGHCPRRQCRQKIPGEFREFADLGRFNLWRPMVVARMCGSKWLSALPTGSKWLSALPTGSSRVQAQPAGRLSSCFRRSSGFS